MAEEEKEKKVRVPTALKRCKQDAKKYLINRIQQSRIRTARAAFGKLTDEAEKTKMAATLYSLIDKAEKGGLYKKNKAARLKSRLMLSIK